MPTISELQRVLDSYQEARLDHDRLLAIEGIAAELVRDAKRNAGTVDTTLFNQLAYAIERRHEDRSEPQ